MPQVQSNAVTLEYERSAPADGAPILPIHGVGAQLVRWPKSLCDALAGSDGAYAGHGKGDRSEVPDLSDCLTMEHGTMTLQRPMAHPDARPS